MVVFLLKYFRKEKNISLQDIHNATGISRNLLNKIDNNLIDDINIKYILKISKILGINWKEIMYSTEDILWVKKQLNHYINEHGFIHPKTLMYSEIISLFTNKINNNRQSSTK